MSTTGFGVGALAVVVLTTRGFTGDACGISVTTSSAGSPTLRCCSWGIRGGEGAGEVVTAEVGSGFVTVYTKAPVAAKPALQINVVIVMMVARVMHVVKASGVQSRNGG